MNDKNTVQRLLEAVALNVPLTDRTANALRSEFMKILEVPADQMMGSRFGAGNEPSWADRYNAHRFPAGTKSI